MENPGNIQEKQTFLVTGASSGLGLSVAKELIRNHQNVILIARNQELLEKIRFSYPANVKIIQGDLTNEKFIPDLIARLPVKLSGAFINAGGPPAGTFRELSLKDWDDAYQLLIRWKVQLTNELLPIFLKNQYGRFLFSESTSITRPVKNLMLSNSLRMSIVGMVKTLVQEFQGTGITFNVIAPGFHNSKAVERLYKKMSEQQNISLDDARNLLSNSIPTRNTGRVEEFATLASWLLGPHSSFVTGQVFNIDGGVSV